MLSKKVHQQRAKRSENMYFLYYFARWATILRARHFSFFLPFFWSCFSFLLACRLLFAPRETHQNGVLSNARIFYYFPAAPYPCKVNHLRVMGVICEFGHGTSLHWHMWPSVPFSPFSPVPSETHQHGCFSHARIFYPFPAALYPCKVGDFLVIGVIGDWGHGTAWHWHMWPSVACSS